MDDWTDSLDGLLDEVWRRLSRGVADRRAPSRHPTLATVGRDGGAEARTVVLRAASREDAVLEVHTDARSEKAAEIAAEPRVTLHVWEPKPRLQIRVRAVIETVAGEAADRRWARIPDGPRLAYGGEPAPGTPLDDPRDHRPGAERARFLPLLAHVRSIDALHLGDAHRRARFDAEDGFAGRWLAP